MFFNGYGFKILAVSKNLKNPNYFIKDELNEAIKPINNSLNILENCFDGLSKDLNLLKNKVNDMDSSLDLLTLNFDKLQDSVKSNTAILVTIEQYIKTRDEIEQVNRANIYKLSSRMKNIEESAGIHSQLNTLITE